MSLRGDSVLQDYLCLAGGDTEKNTALNTLTETCKNIAQKHCCRGRHKLFSPLSPVV